MFKEILEDYIKAQDEHTKAKTQLKEMEIKLATECRRKVTHWSSLDADTKMLASILLGKLQ